MTESPPKRLLHLVSSLEVGGKERVVLDLARRARGLGLDHELLLFDAPYRATGVDFDPGAVPWSFLQRGPGLDLGFARRVRRFVTRGGFEALHAHNDTAIFYAALANLPLRVARTFGTFHTKPGHDTPRARKLTRWATGRHVGVAAVSQELGDVLTELGWSRRPRVIWNGVDLDVYRPADAPRTGDEPVHVVTLARADPIKRAVDLIAAVERARERGGRLRLTLVGNGPLLGEIEACAAGVPGVSVLPRVENVPAFLRSADVFALVSDHEAAPRALLEAMASGLACCVTDVGGMPEILGAGSNEPAGRLVPPRSVEHLADALLELSADPAERRRLGERARRRAGDFSALREWEEHLALWSA
ncbi:Putative glycosyltransferase EpsF [Planctomycetes bacterium Poly30]|uniref:Glycosyltransferase EpsF n=1 Tax=Saltatorellus ferox TaxID=2528018 RepID=A0A518ELS3_9BACT|nr:Putative glycosyltransferase EpsF [Planctomycetes bacterium Poly30]